MKRREQGRGSGTRGSELADKKKGEIFAFLWATSAILLFLCLWSYSPDDIRQEISTPNAPAKNFAGVTGATIAWGLGFVFGKAAYFFVALLFFWALSAWSGSKRQSVSLRLFSGTIFFTSACGLLSLLAGGDARSQFQGGGLFGFFLAHFLTELFGAAGAFYLAAALFFLSVLLATEFLVLPLLVTGFRLLKDAALLAIRRRPGLSRSERPTRDERIPAFRPAPSVGESEKKRPFPLQPDKLTDTVPLFSPFRPRSEIKTLISEKPPDPSAAPKRDGAVLAKEKPASKPGPAAPGAYTLPSMDLLKEPSPEAGGQTREETDREGRVLEETLADFGIETRVVSLEQGPTVTRFELQPASGVKIQKIVALTDNIALAMRATSVRVIAPIPGKALVGVEVPNRSTSLVTLKEVLMSRKFAESKSKLAIAIGKDTAGAPVVANLDAMPHLLIAGSTGSGKTVCVNTIIMSLLYNASPDEVRFILIDPKMVELQAYNGLPHLLTPVVTEVEKVSSVLNWLVSEMERRYRALSAEGVRNITAFNEKAASARLPEPVSAPAGKPLERMPYIVTVIDELADLMVAAGNEVEGGIMRLAQLARAVGIHLVLATQRPSVDVITGVIKANFPARISFQVASKVDSRTVLDMNGADALLGKGDLLFLDPALSKPVRAQGAFVTDAEIERTTGFISRQREAVFDEGILKSAAKKRGQSHDFRNDEFYAEACRIIVSTGQASVSMLQRRLGLGYTRAARLVDMMEEDGIVGPHRGQKPREILVDLETLGRRTKAPEPEGPGA